MRMERRTVERAGVVVRQFWRLHSRRARKKVFYESPAAEVRFMRIADLS
jgi:hypothetical protein